MKQDYRDDIIDAAAYGLRFCALPTLDRAYVLPKESQRGVRCGFSVDSNRQIVPNIKKVIFNEPATIVLWSNGDKTVVKCQDGDKFDKEKGLSLAVMKYVFGNKSKYNDVIKKHCGIEE